MNKKELTRLIISVVYEALKMHDIKAVVEPMRPGTNRVGSKVVAEGKDGRNIFAFVYMNENGQIAFDSGALYAWEKNINIHDPCFLLADPFVLEKMSYELKRRYDKVSYD